MGVIAPALKAGTLTEALKERTWALHTQAERSGIINDILRKKADRRGYALLLRNLLPAYRAMEQALRLGRHRSIFRAFARPELYRTAWIESDLSALMGEKWHTDLPEFPAALLYAERLAAAAEGDGGRLVAHAYVRYFGDLSGGQILKKLLGNALNLPPEALSFYEFPGIADPAAFKTMMRDAIDGDVASSCVSEAVIDEALRAFEYNIAISQAVQDALVSKSRP